jgi:4-amino-4-deoxy-L-arabinose transferase-like glycosyltransferase
VEVKNLSLCSIARASEGKRVWAAVIAILLLSMPLLFFYLGGWGFLDPDEGRYGQIPSQMLMRSDFITPRQNEIKFFDKPPLLYWAIAASYSIFGVKEWAARLVPALAALLGLLAVYGLGRRMFGSRAGVLGAVILATSAMWPVMARIVVTDMLVSALIFLALALWWMGHSEESVASRRQSRYFIGFWVVLALGVLAKGPIAVVLTGGCILLYMLVCRQWQAIPKMRWAIGVPLFLSIAVPWFIIVAQRNPEFNHYFWYDQHIGRFLGHTTGNDHVHGAAYYLEFLPVLFFPWSIFVPFALFTGWRSLRNITSVEPSVKQKSTIYLLSGVAFTTLFFSASSGKLLTYILPTMPLLALLLAAYFDRFLARRELWNRAHSVGVAGLASVLITGGAIVGALTPSKLSSVGVSGSIAIVIGLLLVTWGTTLYVSARRFGLVGTLAGTAGGFTVTFAAMMAILAAVMPQYTTKSLVDYIRPGLASHPQSEVLSVGYIQSVPFYAGHRAEVLGTPDELELGVDHMPLEEKRAWIFNGAAELRDLKEEMHDPYPVYCFIEIPKRKPKKIQKLLQKVGNGAAPIIANKGFLVFGNRAALAATPPVPNEFQG